MKKAILALVLSASLGAAGQAQAQDQASPPPSQSNTSAPKSPMFRPPARAVPEYVGYLPNAFRDDEDGIGYVRAVEAAKLYRSALASADCILDLGEQRPARAFMKADDDELAVGDEIYTRYRGCKRGVDRMLPVAIEGAVAERLLGLDADVAVEPRAMHVDVDEAERFHGDLSGQSVAMSNLARCAAVYSPGLAMNVLRTEVGSNEEVEALSQLFARTPECGPSDRRPVPSALQRGAVAAALLAWTHKG